MSLRAAYRRVLGLIAQGLLADPFVVRCVEGSLAPTNLGRIPRGQTDIFNSGTNYESCPTCGR